MVSDPPISDVRSTKAAYKMLLVGDPKVGKSSIRRRYLGKGFDDNYTMSIGLDFAIKNIGNTMIQIWDLAGQPLFDAIRPTFYQGAQGAILVFDVTSRETIHAISDWLKEIHNAINQKIPCILVGNKTDLRSNSSSDINKIDIEKYREALSNWLGFEVQYIESSALTGDNIELIFIELINQIKNVNRGTKLK